MTQPDTDRAPNTAPEHEVPRLLGLIAGRGSYPLLLAESARRQGVGRIVAVAMYGETDAGLAKLVDEIHWFRVGELQKLLDCFAAAGVKAAVMAGQVTPTSLFRVRVDGRALAALRRLKHRNAETIFGAVGDELATIGVELLPASRFMEAHLPETGCLTRRTPTPEEQQDIAFGFRVAKHTSGLDIGQTVVVKEGTVLAVEAFEGTDATILRAGKLGGPGAVVVKVAKQGHDMRFDIPVVGLRTIKTLTKARATVLALEARRAILLDRAEVVRRADKLGICLVVV